MLTIGLSFYDAVQWHINRDRNGNVMKWYNQNFKD